MPVLVNLIGQKIGRLTVLRRAKNCLRHNKVQWLCVCDCGNRVAVYANRLQQRRNTQIGCGTKCPLRKTDLVAHAKNNFTKHGLTNTAEYTMWTHAKARAKNLSVPFNLEPTDITIPVTCPVLHIKLAVNKRTWKDDSPTLDRIKPALGYVRGNVRVISWRANRLKSDATLGDLEALVLYMKEAA
jgi:hypothetical protein